MQSRTKQDLVSTSIYPFSDLRNPGSLIWGSQSAHQAVVPGSNKIESPQSRWVTATQPSGNSAPASLHTLRALLLRFRGRPARLHEKFTSVVQLLAWCTAMDCKATSQHQEPQSFTSFRIRALETRLIILQHMRLDSHKPRQLTLSRNI